MDRVKAFLVSLMSRKFLLTIAAVATLLANKQYPEAAAAVVAYLTAEGAADVVERAKKKSS
jgi:hypothetical protein